MDIKKLNEELRKINGLSDETVKEISESSEVELNNQEIVSNTKVESVIDEKEDRVYELENKNGHTIWSHQKRMPGYKWTGRQSINAEPTYDGVLGGLKGSEVIEYNANVEEKNEQFDPSNSLYSQHPFPIDKQVKKYKKKKEEVKGRKNKEQAKADYERLKFASKEIKEKNKDK